MEIFSKSFLRYVLVAVLGYVIYLFLLVAMVERLGVDPVLASFLSFIPVFILSYILSYKWVFKSDGSHKSTFVRFLTITLIGLMWNIFIMYTTIHWFDWHYIFSQFLVVTVVAINNFCLNYFWTFKKR
jgi:putative flippase GtrA